MLSIATFFAYGYGIGIGFVVYAIVSSKGRG